MASILDPQFGCRDYSRWASKSLYKRNLDAAPARKWRPFRPTPPNLDAAPTPKRRPNQQPPRIRTPPQPVSGVQSALELKSGRHANHRLASIPPYISNLDATPATDWRPIRPTPPPIRTPRRHPLASKSATTKNLDAAPTRKWRPIRPTPQIWTPRQPPTGVQSAIRLKSGRRADTQQASKSATTKNLDAAPARKWRPPTNPRTRQSLRCHHLNRQSSKQGRWCTDGPQVSSLKPPVPQMSSLKPPAPQI